MPQEYIMSRCALCVFIHAIEGHHLKTSPSKIPPWASLLPLTCLIDGQGSPPERRPIEPVDRRLGLGGVGHLDKAKAPRPAGVAVRGDLDAGDLPIGVKELRQLFL